MTFKSVEEQIEHVIVVCVCMRSYVQQMKVAYVKVGWGRSITGNISDSPISRYEFDKGKEKG
jgi:hypothetical protein